MNNLIDEKVIQSISQKFGINLNEHEEDEYKPVIAIYGPKGGGKTTLALSTPGTILALSYDGQTSIIKEMLVNANPNNRDRIQVVNIAGRVAKLDALVGGSIAVDLTLSILENNKADWIVLDAGENLLQFCERKMRYNNGVTIAEGVDWNLWRERNAYYDQIHNLAVAQANVGVIYTTWEKTEETTIEGKVRKSTVPVWASRMMEASNIVLHVSVDERPSQNKNYYYVHVDSDKANMLFRTGELLDVSDLKPLITMEQLQALNLKLGKKSAINTVNDTQTPIQNSTNTTNPTTHEKPVIPQVHVNNEKPITSQAPTQSNTPTQPPSSATPTPTSPQPQNKPKPIISAQEIEDLFKELGI